jgi:hypothetical protein
VVARHFKKKHRNKGLKDPEMLSFYLSLGGVLVTYDNDMIDEHLDAIPEKGPGIIVIEHSPAVPYTLTQKSAEKIVKKFKETLPDWHAIPWTNSIVRITERSVTVCKKTQATVEYNCEVELSDAVCPHQVRQCLTQNAAA